MDRENQIDINIKVLDRLLKANCDIELKQL